MGTAPAEVSLKIKKRSPVFAWLFYSTPQANKREETSCDEKGRVVLEEVTSARLGGEERSGRSTGTGPGTD